VFLTYEYSQVQASAFLCLCRSYFSVDGIEFNFGRVPVAGTDFSTHTYTYDDVPGDTNFTHFNLTLEDFFYKVSQPPWALMFISFMIFYGLRMHTCSRFKV
jgi:hypothetical protein